MKLAKNDTIVFFGDSVTDCCHLSMPEYEGIGKFEGMGFGFVMMVSSWLKAMYPDYNLNVVNSGIGGNRIYDLETRFEKDVLAHKPQWVNFLIGINDTWRRYDGNTVSSVQDFTACYERMLSQLAKKNVNLVICEPFVAHVPADRATWREDLDPRIQAVRDLARKYKALFIPLDSLFAHAATTLPPDYWLPDGVHPSLGGHALIARAWMKTVGIDVGGA